MSFSLVFQQLFATFAGDLVMYQVFHQCMKRESGANPEQYPLLSSPLWEVQRSH